MTSFLWRGVAFEEKWADKKEKEVLESGENDVCMPPSKLARKVGMCHALITGGPRRESGPLEMRDVISTLVCKQHPN